MTNPMDALASLQAALDEGTVRLRRCDIHPDLEVMLDHPNGTPRFTYAVVAAGVVESIALFALVEPVEDVQCFQLGYAVIEAMRGKGLASQTVLKGMEELHNGLKRNRVGRFYVEAIVATSNIPSNKLARRLLSDSPVSGADAISGGSWTEVWMADSPAEDVINSLRDAAAAMAQLSDEELRTVWDSRSLDQLLDAIFDPDKKAPDELIGDYLLRQKLRATYAASIHTAVTRGYSFAVTEAGNTTYLSPADVQWFPDYVMFTEGPASFEGAVGRYRPGEVSYAIMARSVPKGGNVGPEDMDFIGLNEFQARLEEVRKRPEVELWKPFAELKQLLASTPADETEYQEWIERYPWVLGLKWEEVLRHKQLNDENIPDFTVRRIGKEFHDIIEVKPPSMAVFRADGEFSTDFLRAWDQAERYLDFARRDADYLRRKGIPVDNPRCYLLAGIGITGLELDKLRRKERLNPAMELLTYDDVIVFVEGTIRFIEARAKTNPNSQ